MNSLIKQRWTYVVLLILVAFLLIFYHVSTEPPQVIYHSQLGLDHLKNFTAMIHPTEHDMKSSVESALNLTGLCHSQPPQSSELPSANNVIVFGASSFLGSEIALKADASQFKVFAVEDFSNILIDSYTWQRWDKLSEQGFSPRYVNSSSESELSALLDECGSGSIVYVPSLIFDGVGIKSKPAISLKSVLAVLMNFVTLLEFVATRYKGKFHIVLISLSHTAGLSVQKAWLSTLEVSLSSYQGMYGIQASVVRTNNIYGPLKHPLVVDDSFECLSIDSFVDQVIPSLGKNGGKQCEEREIVECSESHEEHYTTSGVSTDLKKKNVVMSTYFTRKENSMYTIVPDKFYFLKQWFLSARKFGSHIVIIHDELSTDFQEKIRSFYPSVDFVKEDSLHGWSANDGRFYIEYDYILKHPEIDHVVMTDLRDVKFFGDPFKVMEVIGDYIFIGIDVTYLFYSYELQWIQDIFKVCSKHEDHRFLELDPFLNAGVLGGTRHAMLSYLTHINHYLKKTPKFNCNMAAVNFITNKFFHDVSFSGYPLQQGFKLGTAPSQGLAVKHKDTGELDH